MRSRERVIEVDLRTAARLIGISRWRCAEWCRRGLLVARRYPALAVRPRWLIRIDVVTGLPLDRRGRARIDPL